jgi:hypothetical protein
MVPLPSYRSRKPRRGRLRSEFRPSRRWFVRTRIEHSEALTRHGRASHHRIRLSALTSASSPHDGSSSSLTVQTAWRSPPTLAADSGPEPDRPPLHAASQIRDYKARPKTRRRLSGEGSASPVPPIALCPDRRPEGDVTRRRRKARISTPPGRLPGRNSAVTKRNAPGRQRRQSVESRNPRIKSGHRNRH